jgi:hypothetical protein
MSPADSPLHQPQDAPASAGKPWGFWATIGFSVLIAFATVVVEAIVMVGYMVAFHSGPPSIEDGSFVAVSVLASAIAVPVTCIACAALKAGNLC